MGFIQTDCVICYLGGYGNKEAPIREVCSVCIESVYEDEGFGNVQSECIENFAGDGTCDRCHDERIFLFSIGLCDDDVLVDDEDFDYDEDDFDGDDYDEDSEEREEKKEDDNSEE